MNWSALLDSLGKSVLNNVTQHVKDVTTSMAGVNTVVIQAGRESTVKHLVAIEHMEKIVTKLVENVVIQSNAIISMEYVVMDVIVVTRVTSVIRNAWMVSLDKTVHKLVEHIVKVATQLQVFVKMDVILVGKEIFVKQHVTETCMVKTAEKNVEIVCIQYNAII